MNAFVVVKGKTNVDILRALLPKSLLDVTSIVGIGSRSSLPSVARTLLVTYYEPVAVLVNTHALNEAIVQEKKQSTEELLKAVSGKVPVKVILLIPEIESVFFEAPGVLERTFGQKLPKELLLLARNNPQEALAQLFSQGNGPDGLSSLLDSLDERDREALRSTRPIRELMSFISETAGEHLQRTGT